MFVWRDLDAELDRDLERNRVEAERRQRDATLRRQREEDDTVDRLIARDQLAGFQAHLELLIRRMDLRVEWVSEQFASASIRRRLVRIPRVASERDYATGLHEIGHIVDGPCPNVRPHYRDPKARSTWACVQCEVNAHRHGMRLARRWTRKMHEHLAECLATYGRTPTWPAQLKELAKVSGTLTMREAQLRLVRHEDRLQRQRRVNAEVARMKR